MKYIDRLLNNVTTYRLTLYYLLFLLAVACILSWLGILSYDGWRILAFAAISVIACYAANYLLSLFWRADLNDESALITGLLLSLIVPIGNIDDWKFVVAIAVASQLSKYLLSVSRAHVFNPAAAGIAIVALLWPHGAAAWWIGNKFMVIPVLLGGLLLIRKIRRSEVVYSFLITFIIAFTAAALIGGQDLNYIWNHLKIGFTGSALLFFAFLMLTEPLTLPGKANLQRVYGVIVAILYVTPQLKIAYALTPELALCIGNIFSHFLRANQRFILTLQDKKSIGQDIWEFVFDKPKELFFQAGQYLEWTLPHRRSDSRGNRRYFTIAAAPHEAELRLMIKLPAKPSSYKTRLIKLEKGDHVTAGSLEGNFTLPLDGKPLAFLAGGVGVAPFRSFVAEMIAKQQTRDAVMIYSANHFEELSYREIFDKAKPLGLRTVYSLSDVEHLPENWGGEKGFVTEEMVRQQIPDFAKRRFYISGPQPMVQGLERLLAKMRVPRNQIVTDYFPGYA